jgi:hypothetical protein
MKNFGSNVLGRRSVSAGMDTTVTCLVMSFLCDLERETSRVAELFKMFLSGVVLSCVRSLCARK